MQAKVIGWIRISTVYAGVAAAVMALMYHPRYSYSQRGSSAGYSSAWCWIWDSWGTVNLRMVFVELFAIALVCAAICLAPNIIRRLKP
jgi:cobalamin synthase